MKKILEVLQYGETDIRFNTDINLPNNPLVIPEILAKVTAAMSMNLWGGNEMSVLAMIRLLAIADLSLSVNREEMLEQMGVESAVAAETFRRSIEEFNKSGSLIEVFPPSVKPSGRHS